MEQRVVVQAELPADALAVGKDLRAVHVFFRCCPSAAAVPDLRMN